MTSSTHSASGTDWPWRRPEYRRLRRRFLRSRTHAKLRELVALLDRIDDLSYDLLDDFAEGSPAADYFDYPSDIEKGIGSIAHFARWVADIIHNDMPAGFPRRGEEQV